MKTFKKQFLTAVPALGLVLVAGGLFAVAAMETAAPSATVRAGTPESVAAVTDTPAWEEVARGRGRNPTPGSPRRRPTSGGFE